MSSRDVVGIPLVILCLHRRRLQTFILLCFKSMILLDLIVNMSKVSRLKMLIFSFLSFRFKQDILWVVAKTASMGVLMSTHNICYEQSILREFHFYTAKCLKTFIALW